MELSQRERVTEIPLTPLQPSQRLLSAPFLGRRQLPLQLGSLAAAGGQLRAGMQPPTLCALQFEVRGVKLRRPLRGWIDRSAGHLGDGAV